MNQIEKKIQKKVDEINKLIALANLPEDTDVENSYDGKIMVVDTSSTWEEPAIYEPIVFRNGVLYIEYFEPYSNRTKKEKILKRDLEYDGYGTLLDIAKIYRKALKKENIKYAGGGEFMTDPTFGNFQNNVYADGGEIRRFDRQAQMDSETREEILDVLSESDTPKLLTNYLYGLFDGYDYSKTTDFKKEVEILKRKNPKLHQRLSDIYKKIDKYKFIKYRDNYATGGGIETDINFRNFTINELIKKLPQDVEFMWIVEEKTLNFIRRYDKEFKKISNTEFTITDFGTLELSKGSENLYLDIKVMEVSDDAPEVSYFISLFTKDNHKGLKEFSKALIEKFEMGGGVKADRYDGKTEKIVEELKNLKGGLYNKAPRVYQRNGLIFVSAENGDNYADYYEYSIDEKLEYLADKYDTYWDWENAGAIVLEPLSDEDEYANGGVTENYVSRRNLNTITIKKGNQKLTYKISDVLNGAYKLESGAKLEDIAFYVPKRNIVKIQLKTGKDFKPANGYWIKDGAKPIHVTKFDDGGNLDGVNPYQNINSIRERYELLNDMYSNEESNVDYTDILKVGDVVYGDDIQGYARIYKEVNDPEKGDYFIFQDRFDNRFAFYIIQSIRGLRSKELFLQNVGISEKDFLYSPEVININQDLNFAKGRVRLYEKNPNNASNYHGINYDDYISALSKIKPLEENLRLMLKEERHKFDDGGKVTSFTNKDGIRVRSKVEPKEKMSEKEWMMKHNSSREARAYAGGGEINIDIPSEVQSKMTDKELRMYDSYVNLYNKMQDDLDNLKKAKNRKDNEDIKYYNLRIANKKYSIEFIANELSKNQNLKKYIVGFKKGVDYFKVGGKVTFSEKAKAIAKNFEGKRVEPKYQKEYGKVYDKNEAKEVGNKIAGSQKASYDAKLEKGSEVKNGKGNHKMKATTDLARKIRKEGEKWTDAIKRASQQLK